jgi:hypothetical protein
VTGVRAGVARGAHAAMPVIKPRTRKIAIYQGGFTTNLLGERPIQQRRDSPCSL